MMYNLLQNFSPSSSSSSSYSKKEIAISIFLKSHKRMMVFEFLSKKTNITFRPVPQRVGGDDGRRERSISTPIVNVPVGRNASNIVQTGGKKNRLHRNLFLNFKDIFLGLKI